MKSLDPHLQGETLQLTHSTINSQDEMTASGKTNSQDQCASSEYGIDTLKIVKLSLQVSYVYILIFTSSV